MDVARAGWGAAEVTAPSGLTVGRPGRRTSPVRPSPLRRHLGSAPYVGPAWIIVTATGIIPLGYGIWMSLTDQSIGAASERFIGLENYVTAVFTKSFVDSLMVTMLFVVCGIVIQFVIAYLLASLLHLQMRGFQVFRTILLVPMMLTPIVVGLIFRFMFTPNIGVLYFALRDIGLEIPWFTDTLWARVFIIMLDSWLTIPLLMLLLLAGMAGVSEESLEAAQLDGAGWWARTRYVVLPQLTPVITVALLIRIVDAVRMFDQVFATTRGGPGTSTMTVSILAYNQTFGYFAFGPGAAIAVALTVVMFPVYFFYLRMTKV